jgi:phosphonate transport system ATP-binding protein
MSPPSVIDVQNIFKTFRKSGKALQQVHFRVEAGEMVALIGPSGSSKSTLMRHLSGLVPSDAAPSTITLLGHRVQRNGRISSCIRDIRTEVGFICPYYGNFSQALFRSSRSD